MVGSSDEFETEADLHELWRDETYVEVDLVFAPSAPAAIMARSPHWDGWHLQRLRAIRWPDADHFAVLATWPRFEGSMLMLREMGWHDPGEQACEACGLHALGMDDHRVSEADGLCPGCRSHLDGSDPFWPDDDEELIEEELIEAAEDTTL